MNAFLSICCLVVFGLTVSTLTHAQAEFPYPPAEDELRIVTWNIENLGTRTPRRTDQELEDLAQRLLTFDSPVIALQEVSAAAGNGVSAIETVLDHMGPGWKMTAESGNTIVYDETVLELVSFEVLDQLRFPPFNSFYDDYPDWQSEFGTNGDPFTNARSVPSTAVFKNTVAGTGTVFRIISNHFHAGSTSTLAREYEGNAVRIYVEDLLMDISETANIFVVGDFNARPEIEPHPQLEVNGLLAMLAKSNSQNTGVLSSGEANIDHIYASMSIVGQITDQSAFVILPEHYNETPEAFEAVYSDHSPVLIDLKLFNGSGYSGSWFDPLHDGEGWVIQVLNNNRILITWYTYDGLGQQMWLTGVGDLVNGSVHIEEMLISNGGVFGPAFNPDDVELSVWGSLTFTFTDCQNAVASYESIIGFGAGTLGPVRLTRLAGLQCDQ